MTNKKCKFYQLKSALSLLLVDLQFTFEIHLKDFGKGIPKNDLKNIFKKFYKGKNSSSNSVGIGLSLAHTIITKQNGYISVERKENEGTTFKIKFKNK